MTISSGPPGELQPQIITTLKQASELLQDVVRYLSRTRLWTPFVVSTGTAAVGGLATLVAGTITVTTTRVTANTAVHLTVATPGGVLGFLSYTTVVGVSITINSSSAGDTSTVHWTLVELN